jgi:folate-binding protein YgfZ
MIALPYLSVVRFSDADAGGFLQNQLSADVLALGNGESTFACYCEPKGRVLALMLVCRIQESYYAVLSSSLAEAIVERLRIYVMRSKVSIDVLSERTVSGLHSDDMPEPAQTSSPTIPVPGSDRYFLLTEHDMATATDASLVAAWMTSELQRGITWLRPETSGEFLPQMLGFDELGAVNFRKGCYPGQEIVARTHYLGKVKRHPRVLNTTTGICPGLLEKVQVTSGGKAYDAIVADCVQSSGGACLFVVTRMNPDLAAEKVEYGGKAEAVL